VRISVAEWTQLDEFINSLKPDTRRALYLVMAQSRRSAAISRWATWRRGVALDLSPEIRSSASARCSFALRPALALPISRRVRCCCGEVDRARLPSGDQPIYDAAPL